MPVVHRFTYPFYCTSIFLDELDELDKTVRGFSYNTFNVFSLFDRDYLPGREGAIQKRLEHFLEPLPLEQRIERIELISTPRFCGYVFNPVSFYRCFSAEGDLLAAVAEVNNTFGETHLYLLAEQEHPEKNSFVLYRRCKEFHVSPFNDMSGEYLFYFLRSEETLDIRVNLVRQGKTVFTSRMFGDQRAFTSDNVLKILRKYPLSAILTTPRIMAQAAALRFQKKLPVFTKPIASSDMTIRATEPGRIQRLAMTMCFRFLSRIKRGCLTVEFPDGMQHIFGEQGTQPAATLYVKNYDLFVRSILFGDIGFGESFIDGQWEANDLTALFQIFLENEGDLDDRSIVMSYVGRVINAFRQVLRSNTRAGSKKNIGAHYDLSNELFSTFLDPSMTYSCARFSAADDSLDQAQQNKINSIIEKAALKSTDHVLEIGCGWGSFAIAAAKQVGCKVTGLTLSKEQRDLALQRVAEEGLEDKVQIKLLDYREVTGRFDKIVSIEMVEAVGHRYLGGFFRLCDRVLKPNGLVVFQVITFPDYRYDAYRLGCDWIQKYIFPGGLCPSLTALCNALSKNSRLMVEDVENIGVHYATTLREWRSRFQQNTEKIEQLGFDEQFFRIWDYYFSYCEAGFSMRTLGTLQIVLTRTNNKLLPMNASRHPVQLTDTPRQKLVNL